MNVSNVKDPQTGTYLTSTGETVIKVEIEASKFEMKPKEASRLNKLAAERDFTKILESKADLNFKIAKLISNAIGWKIDFNAFKACKTTL